MARLIYRLPFSLGLNLLAISPAVLPAREPASVKDFSEVSLAELGIALVEEKRDPNTEFMVGGKNPTALLEKLTEINGRTTDQLEKVMRPRCCFREGVFGTRGMAD